MRRPIAVVALSCAALCAAAPLSAQDLTDQSTRGVRVLEAEPEAEAPAPAPAPAPKPVPTPKVAPKPAPAPPTPVLQFCTKPFATPDVKLTDGTGFDTDLAGRLRSGKRVVIDLAQPYQDDAAAPDPLSPWLAEVKANGGTVRVKEYCEAARGALGEWFAKIFGGGKSKPASVYRDARKYDVILHADALDKVITQVEFSPKSARART